MRWHMTYSVGTDILAEWLEHYIEEAWLPLFEHPISTWAWGGAAILPTRVFRNWPSGNIKSVVLTIEGKVMSRSGWSAYAEDNYKDLCTIKVVPAGEQESDVFVSTEHAALETYLVALLKEVRKRFGQTRSQRIELEHEDEVRGVVWQLEEEAAPKEKTTFSESTGNITLDPSPEIDPPVEHTDDLADESGISPTDDPDKTNTDANPPKPWEKIDDKGYDRQLLELWWRGFGADQIGKRFDLTAKRIRNRLSILRGKYGDAIVPYAKNVPEDFEGGD